MPAKALTTTRSSQIGDVDGLGESPGLANSFVKVKDTQGIVDGDSHVYRKLMKGSFENRDVGVRA